MTAGNAEPHRSAHRANYTLEMGTWHATCKECGFRVSDADRRRAAAVYREHIKEMNQSVPGPGLELDLTEPAPTVKDVIAQPAVG